MKLKSLLLITALVLMAGCQATETISPLPTLQESLIAAQAHGSEEFEALVVLSIVNQWIANGDDDQPAVMKMGDDDAPNQGIACGVQGTPRCEKLADGIDKCADMCGETFYIVEYAPGESVCVSGGGAYVYACTGSNY